MALLMASTQPKRSTSSLAMKRYSAPLGSLRAEGGREGGREGGKEGEGKGERKRGGGRERGRERGREGERKRGKKGGREGGRGWEERIYIPVYIIETHQTRQGKHNNTNRDSSLSLLFKENNELPQVGFEPTSLFH